MFFLYISRFLLTLFGPDYQGLYKGENLHISHVLVTIVGLDYQQGLVTGHDPARRSGQEGFKTSRVESGRVRRCGNLTGWVESSHEVTKYHESGRVTLTRPDTTRPAKRPSDYYLLPQYALRIVL